MASEAEGIVLSVLLPVRNEGDNVRPIIKMLRGVIDVPYEVLVVYDDPNDETAAVIRSLSASRPELRGVLNDQGRGIPGAIRSGVNTARGQYVVIFAADDPVPALSVEDMVALMENGCDFVAGTRYAHGGKRLGGSLTGGFLSRLANRLFCLAIGSAFTDATTGCKMFRRDVFDRLDLQSRPVGWAVAFEMAIKAQMAGLRLGEVPIVAVDRIHGGRSSFTLGPWFKEYLRWFIWASWRLRRAPRVSPPMRVSRSTALRGTR